MEPERALWSPPPDMPRRRGRDFSARLPAVLAVVLVLVIGVAFVLPQGGLLPRLDQLSGFDQTAATPALPTDAIALASIAPSPSPIILRPTPTPLPSFRVYVVKSGDSLNSIARRFDTTARSIAYWNRATYPSLDPESSAYKPGLIEIGWRLQVIPGVVVDEDDLPSPSPTASASPAPSQSPAPPTPTPTSIPITTDPSIVIAHGDRT